MNTESIKTKSTTQGIIRWGAILPFTIICLLTAAYFHFFFDGHLRRGVEWAGYKALGAELDIAELNSSFLNASIEIKGIELTDAEKPTHDSLKIGKIRFGMLWDALLRFKFVINEATIEQIEFGVQRKKPGQVAPPPPVSKEPGLIATEGEKISDKAQQEIETRVQGNVLGDVIGMLGSSDTNAPIQKLQESLPSKALIDKFQKDLDDKQKIWDARLKTLPQGKEIQALGERLNKIQTKDFKNPQELVNSLQQLQALFQDADGKYKQISALNNDFNKDLNNLKDQYSEIEKQVKIDTKNLEQHFKIPQLDAKELTIAVFQSYLAPYKAKFFRYKSMAKKYLPPKFFKKNKTSEPDESLAIQAHPREKGITYEFPKPNSYPFFWVKKAAISSQAGLTANSGNIKGEILDMTSNQALVGRPTVADLSGDFPGMGIFGFLLKISLDNRKEESDINYLFQVGTYNIEEKELINSPEVNISIKKAKATMNLQGQLLGFKNLKVDFQNKFSNIEYAISANNQIADQIIKSVFAGIPIVSLSAAGQGSLPNVPLNIESNLGKELQKGFQNQMQAKVAEAQKKIQALIDQEVGKQKAEVEGKLNSLKSLFDSEVKNAQRQLEEQKKQAESKVTAAKNDAEGQGRKKLEIEGKKALDELKKKMGF